MIESVIGKTNFHFNDEEIILKLINLGVRYIKFIFIRDVDNKTILVALAKTNEHTDSSRLYCKVKVGKGIFIKTPIIFQPYIGKKVQCYCENTFLIKNEIFRIRPVDFIFVKKEFNNNPQCYFDINPHFTKSGAISLSKHYIVTHGIKNAFNYNISFADNTHTLLTSGKLVAYLIHSKEESYFSFKLKKTYSGLYAKTGNLPEIVRNFRKNLNDFKYVSTEPDPLHEYGTIVFKEET